MLLRCVGHQAGVGHDHCVGAQHGGGVHGAVPAVHLPHLRKGVDGEEHFRAARAGLRHARADVVLRKIQAAEVARVGGVAQPQVDGIRAVLQGHAQGRQ
ncbi:hypothetical protein D3C85_1458210 [compost metagenome]